MQTILFALFLFSSTPKASVVSAEELQIVHDIICRYNPDCQDTVYALLRDKPKFMIFSPHYPAEDAILLNVRRCGQDTNIEVGIGTVNKQRLEEKLISFYSARALGIEIFNTVNAFCHDIIKTWINRATP